MTDPLWALRPLVISAVRAAFGDEAANQDPALHRSAHADFQADVALALARKFKKNPRDVATAIAQALSTPDVQAVIASAEISGPGFINLKLQPGFLATSLRAMAQSERLGVAKSAAPVKVVVDFSGPNVAKEMHVGHIRSTIIGDSLCRVLEFEGHEVIRQNHIGDWGTPFGMLIEHLVDQKNNAAGDANVRQLGGFYRAARAKFDADPVFAERSRQRVVRLQAGDPATVALWRGLIDVSVAHFTEVYDRLGVTLKASHVAGESTYNADLPGLVALLEETGLARISEGAVCVFPPGFTGREGEAQPLIVRKQDGGYGYATTDLAAVRRRTTTMGARRAIYVIGAPQTQHLAMVFATARLAGWAGGDVRLEHVAFGSILGPDKKMLKTRSGDSVPLLALLEEAVERAVAAVRAKAPDLAADKQTAIAQAVGIGAIKYADLSNDRIKDYVFDWDRMLSFEGNTAPYLMYAHARIRSILRKAAEAGALPGPLLIAEPAERALALELLPFGTVIGKTSETLQPHRLCQHLHDVATAFSAFYEHCPVMKSEGDVRASRLSLCDLTARVLACGLDLLGISAPEQM